ncbi:site-specific integrase [Flavobacterium ammonificans]|uniref:site-specific integrase n=1 Tax=Flavobacterium ammonificans TaxID=1751056 RepID=UPI001E4D8687|nr:site-specific integrase [Flavobacterium ammonificans]BDB56071.1 tyrosine recombinase [Flavobacterium ammonificans]
MSTVKFTLKNIPNKNKEYSIILVLVKDRKNTSISIGQTCKKEDWCFDSCRLKTNNTKHRSINRFIEKINLRIDDFMHERKMLEESYSLSDLVNEIKREDTKPNSLDYFNFHQEVINEFNNSGKTGSAKINKDTLASLKKYHQKDQLKFTELNVEFLQKYDSYLRSRGGIDSGIGIKMRTIRAIYNKAIQRKIIPDRFYPFKTVKISNLKNENKKEYLTENEIKLIINKDFIQNKKLQFAKDMYLFSFYCRGMNFIDLMKLNHTNLFENRISYIRTKTGVHLEFKLISSAQEILNYYSQKSFNNYLFPVLLNENMTPLQLKNREHKILGQINKSLKEILQVLEINKNITFYTARHSFATYLKFNNVSIDAVSEMLGHTNIKTTQSYLSKLPNKKLDTIVDNVFEKF